MSKLNEQEYVLMMNLIQLGLEKLTQDTSVALNKIAPKPKKSESNEISNPSEELNADK